MGDDLGQRPSLKYNYLVYRNKTDMARRLLLHWDRIQQGDTVDNPTSQTYNVLWLDPVAPLVETELLRLRAAGMKLLAVPTLEELKRAMCKARALVIRLSRDTALLTEVQVLMRGFRNPLPVVCRVDRHHLEVGVQAMHDGATHVLPSDEWSEESWRAVLGRLARPAEPEQQAYVFVDPISQKLLELTRRVAQAGVTTLLTGPTGAGKEVMARVLHDASPRRNGPFVGLNCAAMPETMIEDLLFGHEKGAFTGATREHPGVFEQAEGGSLFLDEIAEMPYALQTKLLRVLQERQLTRLGGRHPVPVDVRLITATNKDLRAAMKAHEFREDLYFRISTFPLRVPALAERRQDILPLARHLLEVHAAGAEPRELTEDAESLLLTYGWPGNVRELSNVIQRALVLSGGPLITAEHLMFEERSFEAAGVLHHDMALQPELPARCDGVVQDAALGPAVRSSEHRVIVAALRASGNRIEAAKVLGISPRTLRYKLAQLRDHGFSVTAAKQG